MNAPLQVPDGWDKAAVNDLLAYHSTISYNLTTQRTALESALIPITAYITVACVEAYRRYPELMQEIAAAMPPEEIGRRGRTLGTEIDLVRLWSIANFHILGRTILLGVGMLDLEADVARTAIVLDFWKRAATAFHGDTGALQADDSAGIVTPLAQHVDEIYAGCLPIVDDAHRARRSRLNALLTSYEFLLWFDTRSGYQDSGPYQLPDGRTLLLRHYVKVGVSDFAWSTEVANAMPYKTVLCAFVLNGVDFHVTDFGTAVTKPEDYLPHVEAFGLFDTANGGLQSIDDAGIEALTVAAKSAQKEQYRMIAKMERAEKIDAGAYVYFSFLRPFADVAGIADRQDWSVPRDSLDLYPLLSLIDGSPETAPLEDPSQYYPPIP